VIDSAQLKAEARKWSRVHGVDYRTGEALAELAGSIADQIVVDSIKRLDIQPGEILVATCPADTDMETLAGLKDRLQAGLPDSIKLLVVTNVEFHILSAQAAEGAATDEPMRA